MPEEYRPAELKGFVFDYLIEKEYEIDVYAEEVLEERIRMMLGAKSSNPIRDSVAIGKEGIKNAEKELPKLLQRWQLQEIMKMQTSWFCIEKISSEFEIDLNRLLE